MLKNDEKNVRGASYFKGQSLHQKQRFLKPNSIITDK